MSSLKATTFSLGVQKIPTFSQRLDCTHVTTQVYTLDTLLRARRGGELFSAFGSPLP
jgi:hypothetical protein